MTRNDPSVELLTGPLREELRRAVAAMGVHGFEPQLERPADASHGDFASNAGLVLARQLGRPPRALAQEIAGRMDPRAARVVGIEVAGPGFLNFRLDDSLFWGGLQDVLQAPDGWGRSRAECPQKVNVEFVSANPTGPLHVAHGRGAAIGDATASLLDWTGHDVTREFYVNDAGRQIELLGESVEARYLQSRGDQTPIPDGGYQGEYVADIAARIAKEMGPPALAAMETSERRCLLARRAAEILREEQERDLAEFGVRMDVFFEESSLFARAEVDELLRRLESSGHTYRDQGALWLRTADRGDEKDRVLVKSD